MPAGSMRGTTLRRFFLAMFVLLPVQFGAAKLCEHLYGIEIWPAVVAPSFARVYTTDDAIEVPHPEVFVTFGDGTREPVPVARLLADLPVSHRRSVMRSQFSHDYGLAGGAAPDPVTMRWVEQRLRTLYPERQAQRVEVRWVRAEYRRAGDALRPVRSTAFDSVTVALPSQAPAQAR